MIDLLIPVLCPVGVIGFYLWLAGWVLRVLTTDPRHRSTR